MKDHLKIIGILTVFVAIYVISHKRKKNRENDKV
jgi:uncharacterized membrane protein YfcA